MIAPLPRDPLAESADVEDVRSVFRDTLKKLKVKKKNGGLQADSRLFKLQEKLTDQRRTRVLAKESPPQ